MPGREIPVTPEEYEEMTFDTGFMSLVNGHYLKVMGIEEEQQVEVVENVFEASEIEKMLVNGDVTKFAKFIPNATEAEKESAVTLAVEHKITNAGIVALIKKYCGIDVISAIAAKHDAEEK
jgi:predicted amidohydrolase YtcJ